MPWVRFVRSRHGMSGTHARPGQACDDDHPKCQDALHAARVRTHNVPFRLNRPEQGLSHLGTQGALFTVSHLPGNVVILRLALLVGASAWGAGRLVASTAGTTQREQSAMDAVSAAFLNAESAFDVYLNTGNETVGDRGGQTGLRSRFLPQSCRRTH